MEGDVDGIDYLNFKRLRKSDIIWLWEHYCKRHNRRYTEHPYCFSKDEPEDSPLTERIGFVDIETTGLNANWDYIISYAILDDKMYGRVLHPHEVKDFRILDKFLMKEFCEDIHNFDKVVVYWGRDRRHDCPFLRTRSLKWGLEFPLYQEVRCIDLYDIAKNKLSLHRYRLENVCNFLRIPSKAHRLDAEKWLQAKKGYLPALKYVWEHNIEDVRSLKEAYERLERFVGITNRSM